MGIFLGVWKRCCALVGGQLRFERMAERTQCRWLSREVVEMGRWPDSVPAGQDLWDRRFEWNRDEVRLVENRQRRFSELVNRAQERLQAVARADGQIALSARKDLNSASRMIWLLPVSRETRERSWRHMINVADKIGSSVGESLYEFRLAVRPVLRGVAELIESKKAELPRAAETRLF
jgi:hypothetical protein